MWLLRGQQQLRRVPLCRSNANASFASQRSVLFFGTDDVSVATLKQLHANRCDGSRWTDHSCATLTMSLAHCWTAANCGTTAD